MRVGEKAVRDAFAQQAEGCVTLGSPFTGRLCDLFARRLRPGGAVANKLLAWPATEDPRLAALALRVAGALHALVLGGRSPQLAAVYPPRFDPSDDDLLWEAVSRALEEHAEFILERLDSPPQTNEIGRAAILFPAFLTIAAISGHPLALSEIGASAGLNLFWDEFGYTLGDTRWGRAHAPVTLAPKWTGRAPELAPIRISRRRGCDLRPIDPADPKQQLRLLSYIWADQHDRIARTRAALSIAAANPVHIERADAASWLESRLAEPLQHEVHVICHTIVWQYLDADTQRACETLIREAGDTATEDAPIVWLRFEPDAIGPGGAIRLTAWPFGIDRMLGRAGFHGQWIEWGDR